MPTPQGHIDHRVLTRVQWRALEDSPDGVRRLSGIASTPTRDRMGDEVIPTGAVFSLPLPLLWQHDAGASIGNVVSAKVTDAGILIDAEFRPTGDDFTDRTITSRWAQLKGGLVSWLSIGFRELKSKAGKAGRVFTDWELLEVSAVTIPANPDCAITAVRAYPAARCDAPPRPSRTASGAKNMTTAERIASTKAALAEKNERLAMLLQLDDIDDDDLIEAEEIKADIGRLERTLKLHEGAQAGAIAGARPAGGGTTAVTVRASNPSRPQIIVNRQREAVKGDLIYKALTAAVYCHAERKSLDEVLPQRFGGNSELEMFLRAVSAPADTATPGWAAELVQTTIGDWLDDLTSVSIYAALTGVGMRFGFGRAGKVTLPYRGGGPNDLAGNWIGEGQPIPVKQTTIVAKTLAPSKLAVISTFTRELAMRSTPEIEGLIRQFILADTALALDTYLLDTVAASAIRPAGLLNGVTPIPSSGAGLENLIKDMRAAVTAITTAGGGSNLVWIMNPADAIAIAYTTDAIGNFVFADQITNNRLLTARVIVSTHIAAGSVVLVDAAFFASALGDTPAFDVSDVATLHMESETPLPIVSGPQVTPVVASPVRSLWQTASVGVRMIQDVSWGMLRPGMIQQITGVDW